MSDDSRPAPRKLLSVQNARSIVGSWIFTILWCGISFTVFWVFAFRARDLMGGAIGGLFALFGLVMLYASVKMTLEYFKYGRVYLTLEGEPPIAGGSFSAKLDLPGEAAVAGHLSGELACVRVAWTRGDKSVSKGEQDAWTRKQVFPIRRSTIGGYALLRIEVPADQPASDLPSEDPPDAMLEVGHPAGIEIGRDYYRWELRVKADVPGVDLDRTFKLHVDPAKQGATARPGVATATSPQVNPVFSADLERRLDARRAAERKLSAACAFVGFAPFVVPFAIAGLAAGLAGCPMSWSTSRPPSCEFAGINWGPVMSGAFDLMFYAVPAGIAGSALLYFAGQWWLNRVHQTDRMGGRGGLAIGLVVTAFVVFQAWQFMRPVRTVQPVAAPAQPPSPGLQDASVAGAARRGGSSETTGTWQVQEADEDRLKKTIASLAQDGGSDLPAAAMAQYQLSVVYERRHKAAEQEQALLHALAILENYPAAEVRKSLGPGGGWLDKEVVARRLGDFYWDQHRYDQAYVHYDRAYRYVSDVQVSDFERNRRLARNSAGRMAGACTQGDWSVADQAMQELKERIVNVDPETRKQLEYWIRTGEPRLAARKC